MLYRFCYQKQAGRDRTQKKRASSNVHNRKASRTSACRSIIPSFPTLTRQPGAVQYQSQITTYTAPRISGVRFRCHERATRGSKTRVLPIRLRGKGVGNQDVIGYQGKPVDVGPLTCLYLQGPPWNLVACVTSGGPCIHAMKFRTSTRSEALAITDDDISCVTYSRFAQFIIQLLVAHSAPFSFKSHNNYLYFALFLYYNTSLPHTLP
jgi:hypothetical protein